MNVSLPRQLEEFVAELVRSSRFKDSDEVLRTALRQMQESERQRAMQSCEAALREIDQHSPSGEPSAGDLVEIDRIIKSVRMARRRSKTA